MTSKLNVVLTWGPICIFALSVVFLLMLIFPSPLSNVLLKRAVVDILQGYGYIPVWGMTSAEKTEASETSGQVDSLVYLLQDSPVRQSFKFRVFSPNEHGVTPIVLPGNKVLYIVSKGELKNEFGLAVNPERFITQVNGALLRDIRIIRWTLIKYVLLPVGLIVSAEWLWHLYVMSKTKIMVGLKRYYGRFIAPVSKEEKEIGFEIVQTKAEQTVPAQTIIVDSAKRELDLESYYGMIRKELALVPDRERRIRLRVDFRNLQTDRRRRIPKAQKFLKRVQDSQLQYMPPVEYSIESPELKRSKVSVVVENREGLSGALGPKSWHYEEVQSILRAHGWFERPSSGTSHVVFVHEDGRTIPFRQSSGEISREMLLHQLVIANFTRQEVLRTFHSE